MALPALQQRQALAAAKAAGQAPFYNVELSWNGGTPKYHPFCGVPLYGNPHGRNRPGRTASHGLRNPGGSRGGSEEIPQCARGHEGDQSAVDVLL